MGRHHKPREGFGAQLTERRESRGLTQKQLGDLLGFSQSLMAEWETNKKAIPLGAATKFGKYFKAPARDFTSDLRAWWETHVFIIFAARREQWQQELALEFFTHLRAAGLTVTPLFPEGDYQWDEHCRLRAEALRDESHYAGGIVIAPVWDGEKFDALIQFGKELGKPVVFVDQNPTSIQASYRKMSPL